MSTYEAVIGLFENDEDISMEEEVSFGLPDLNQIFTPEELDYILGESTSNSKIIISICYHSFLNIKIIYFRPEWFVCLSDTNLTNSLITRFAGIKRNWNWLQLPISKRFECVHFQLAHLFTKNWMLLISELAELVDGIANDLYSK